jgi:hypothetical protein
MTQQDDWSYRHRPRPFGGEVCFRLEGETLVIDTGRKVENWALRDIAVIRMTYEPKSVVWQGFRLKMTHKNGRNLSLTNLNWKSYVHVDRQDDDYTHFVSDLITRTEAANPRLVCIAGKTAMVYYATVLLGTSTTLLMSAMTVLAALNGSVAYAALAALFILPFAQMSWALSHRNKPEFFKKTDIPARVLPDQVR